MRHILRSIVGPAVGASVLTSTQLWGALPRPDDLAHVYSPGPDPDRILLFGAGGVAGLGVTSHELGLGGQLARILSSMTGRGADIEIDGVPSRSLARSVHDLRDHDLSRFDALVVQVGAKEAISLHSVRPWRREIVAFVRSIEESAPAGLGVFFFGLPPMPPDVGMDSGVEAIVNRHSIRLNAVSRAACASSRVQFIDFEPRSTAPGSRYGGVSTYTGWAEAMASGIASWLTTAAVTVHDTAVDEDLRVRSLLELVELPNPGDGRFDAIVTTAHDFFGCRAAINFIDAECQWSYAGAMSDPPAVPRAGTFCNIAIARDEIYVIPDTDLDPLWKDHGNGAGDRRIRFYAGYPIEAPNGQRIGTLCLIDVVPHDFSAEDGALLRELALRAQGVLWDSRPASTAR